MFGTGHRGVYTSPSFVIMRELHGRLPLYHMDFYRLDNIDEIADLGLDDIYMVSASAYRMGGKGNGYLPDDHLLVKIRYISDSNALLNLFAR
jgi:tRNA threonylcarbamoyladenosine biosynthesis protein TsaE